jgi:glycosyltransferase involved in cell wall biosynthesis
LSINRKRVAIIIYDMNWRGGTQRMAARLGSSLLDEYDVRIVTCEANSREPAFKDDRLTYHTFAIDRAGGRLGTIAWIIKLILAVRQYCHREKIDFAISMWYDLAVPMAIALWKTSTTKIAWEHIEYGHASKKWRLLRRLFYPHLDEVVCLTEADLDSYKAINKNTTVIRNFVPDKGVVNQAGKKKIILSVGHFEWRKGHDRLLWEIKEVLQRHPDWELRLIGGGDLGLSDDRYVDHLSGLLMALGIGKQVNILPATNHIDDHFAQASIYAMASRREGLPMVLLEAKMAGLPIVAFDCPSGPAEIIRHEKDGFLVKEGSGLFGQYLERLIGDADMRQNFALAARGDAEERFARQTIEQQWHLLLSKLGHSQRG